MAGGGTARAQGRLSEAAAALPEQDAHGCAPEGRSERRSCSPTRRADRARPTWLLRRGAARRWRARLEASSPDVRQLGAWIVEHRSGPIWSSSAAATVPSMPRPTPWSKPGCRLDPAARHGQRPGPHARDADDLMRPPHHRRGPNPPDRPRPGQRQAFFQCRQPRPERAGHAQLAGDVKRPWGVLGISTDPVARARPSVCGRGPLRWHPGVRPDHADRGRQRTLLRRRHDHRRRRRDR